MTVQSLAATEQDLYRIVGAIRQLCDFVNLTPPLLLGGYASNVNLNSANTDTAIRIASPTANYGIRSIFIKNKGTTASLTTATAGLFTAAAAGGLALAANQALSAITSNAVDTDANGLALAAAIGARTWIDYTTLYFRVGTAQGAAATADVYVFIQPFP